MRDGAGHGLLVPMLEASRRIFGLPEFRFRAVAGGTRGLPYGRPVRSGGGPEPVCISWCPRRDDEEPMTTTPNCLLWRRLLLAAWWGLAGCSGSPLQLPPVDPEPVGPEPPGAEPERVTEALNAVNVERILFYSDSVGGPVSAHVYLPDAYRTDPSRRFPVLYWLHGAGSGIRGIPGLGAFT